MHSTLAQALNGQMILAPLTRGGNLPFRRLCAEHGCEVAVGEMVYARHLLSGSPLEKTRLRRAPNEALFGVQIATNEVSEGRAAVKLAAEAGANWVDLNCGCPIHEATRRNLGSALLRYPDKLSALVRGVAQDSPLPLSVKVRLAAEGAPVNVREVVCKLREAGAAAVSIHGRTAMDRYSRAADWELIGQVVADGKSAGSAVPIIGNGDILTHYEATQRMDAHGVDGVMVGRGALMKPWLFSEFSNQRTWEPSAAERVEVYRQLVSYMKEHFGDDALGRKKAFYFLPWHLDFLSRYRPLPSTRFAEAALGTPLMQTRMQPLGEHDPPLDRLLGHTDPAVHEMIANCLWEADSDGDACRSLGALAESAQLAAIACANGGGDRQRAEDVELSNIPRGAAATPSGAGKHKYKRRPPKPQRSEEEIAELRAVRAAKRLATGAPPHVSGKR